MAPDLSFKELTLFLGPAGDKSQSLPSHLSFLMDVALDFFRE